MLGVLAGLIVFSRRAQRAVYGQMEGQVGAAAGALGLLKRGWHVDNAVAFTKQQDVVHRVVGPPGIVLVGEGNPGRLKALLTAERKRHERVATDTPVHEIVVGSDEGQVPLAKLLASRAEDEASGPSPPRSPTSWPGSRRSTPPARPSRCPRVRCRRR